jgi:hypothetical protein
MGQTHQFKKEKESLQFYFSCCLIVLKIKIANYYTEEINQVPLSKFKAHFKSYTKVQYLLHRVQYFHLVFLTSVS